MAQVQSGGNSGAKFSSKKEQINVRLAWFFLRMIERISFRRLTILCELAGLGSQVDWSDSFSYSVPEQMLIQQLDSFA